VHSGDLHEPRADANLPEGSSDFTYGLERLAAAAPIGALLDDHQARGHPCRMDE